MPGISGIVTSRTPVERPEGTLEAFHRVHALRGVRFPHRSHSSPFCVIDIALTGLLKSSLEQPVCDSKGDVFLFLEGEIFNLDELKGRDRSTENTPGPAALLASYVEQGADFVQRLDGNFTIVIYERKENRLLIFNDRFATKPMYYMEEDGALLFGSEKKSILAVKRDSPAVDGLGLLQVFAHRHNLEGRTFLQGLRCLLPASRLEFSRGRLSLTSYGQVKGNAASSIPPARILVEEWASLLRKAIERRLAGKNRVLMSLSGGLDSRAIACAIPRDIRPLWARTRGYPDSREVICATEVAKRLGFTHYREDPTAARYSDILPKILWRIEGAVTFVNGITLPNHALMKEHGDFILGGQYGDVSSGAHIYPYMFLPRSRSSFLERAYRWYRVYSDRSLLRVFNPEFLLKSSPLLKEAFLSSFQRIEAEGNIELYETWDLLERQARMTIGVAPVDSHLFEKVYPFLDREYMSFALGLPTRLRFGQSLYQAMIHHLGPELRDVPNANTGLTLRATVAGNRWQKALNLAKKGKSKVLRRFGLAQPFHSERASREGIAEAGRQDPEFRRVIEDSVRSSALDPGIFNGPGILKLLEEYYGGSDAHAHLVCLVATFAVALPWFVHGRPVSCPEGAEPLNLLAGAPD